ncbi:malto-oligosyltrehalose trehalohydrolase [Kocuria sp. JC486]|uniref:malto-oligosyltrehalose trehalohydrolase n=1 Tax=Kocuria sp. JC486 TaxID=1970736 RepID=UPI00141FFEF9|nr:malto-oligosyltrehalose trehalohydrolase [Kocuria sp. JC486]NHU84798.1 malto-oligosyltrehalose trehalohydrolase [Kocuria sp. JC486]
MSIPNTARPDNGRAHLDRFDLFAPHAAGVVVRIDGEELDMVPAETLPDHQPRGLDPSPRYTRTERGTAGWWTLPDSAAASVPSSTVRYGYLLTKTKDEGTDKEQHFTSEVLPDPRSPRQPQGVHDLSCTFDPTEFEWGDGDWTGRPLEGAILYELHIGTFTEEGTFDAAIQHLDDLAELGVDTIELLPVNGFNGTHNWGYDGVAWYTVQEEYGGPAGYQRFVDACHSRGMAVVQDVVYNHLGPSGNYLPQFLEIFTAGNSSWGDQINLDDWGSDGVRDLILDNVRMWVEDYHVDGFRVDAVHALKDERAVHILQEMSQVAHETAARAGRSTYLIAESDKNDPRMIQPVDRNGLGMDAQWLDDWHHAAHWALTGEEQGYYEDFAGLHTLAKSYTAGYYHDGTFSTFRGRSHGQPVDPEHNRPWQFVSYIMNHDQVGNRAAGDRFSQYLTVDQQVLAAAVLLTQPFTPMVFMGEEWGASTPWPFFTSHPEPELAEAVRTGRIGEFARMGWKESEIADPQDPETFSSAVLKHDERNGGGHARVHTAYRELIAVRRSTPELTEQDFRSIRVSVDEAAKTLVLYRGDLARLEDGEPREAVSGVAVAFNFGDTPTSVAVELPTSAQMLWAAAPVQMAPGELGGAVVELPAYGAAVLRV